MKPAELQRIRGKELRMTQEELATQLRVTRVTVARWETGERGISGMAARMVELLLAERRQLEKDVVALRAAAANRRPTSDLTNIAERIEKQLGDRGRLYAKALRRDARDRNAVARTLTMVLDVINPTKKPIE